jgi:hypothetical protein
MRTLRISEWKAFYAAWKAANPDLCGDEFKLRRQKVVRGCRGKALYDDYAEAMRVVADLPVREGKVLHAYRCPICGCFHVGNTAFKKYQGYKI